MAPKKLTEADKTSILKLYREPEETTSTLADRFGVSNSTISRLLKATLPQKEYRRLIQQKRSTADKGTAGAGSSKSVEKEQDSSAQGKAKAESTLAEAAPQVDKSAPKLKPKKADATTPAVTPEDSTVPEAKEKPTPVKRTRRRFKSSPQPDESAAQLTLPTEEEQTETPQPSSPEPPKLKTESVRAEVDEEVTETIPSDWDEDVAALDDDYDEDDDDDDDDDFDEEGEAWDGDEDDAAPHVERLEISPLTEASLPRLCYVVVERSSSELVALPLRTFAHLGEIPETEGESRTLPVFDNHRVARRFSRRNQRVVKLPDGNLLQTTSPYLMAKGITRLLIDGQVFALEEDDELEDNGNFD
jgi:transposase-like protein